MSDEREMKFELSMLDEEIRRRAPTAEEALPLVIECGAHFIGALAGLLQAIAPPGAEGDIAAYAKSACDVIVEMLEKDRH